MTLFGDPEDCGYVHRLRRIYRELRAPIPIREEPNLARIVHRRMSRRTAFQIARHQAANARRVQRGV
jgi:hypothetical protein